LVFNKNRKVIGRYLNNVVVSDSESIMIAKKHNLPIDVSLDTVEQKMDSSTISTDSMENSFYDNHPAFQLEINEMPPSLSPMSSVSISTDFVELLTDEFRNKLNGKVNELIYKIMDLEATLKNLSEDYDQLLLENQQLKKQVGKQI
jgi:hypothetical protein